MKTVGSFLMALSINFVIDMMLAKSLVHEICIDSPLACVAVLRGGLL